MKYKCKCGEILSNSSTPNDIELRVYTEAEFEDILNLESVDDIPFRNI